MPGILHARAATEHFRYAEATPSPGLAPFVAHYWIVTWDLTGRDPYEQHVLPYPSVNVTFTAGRCRVAGVPRGRFSEVLTGAGNSPRIERIGLDDVWGESADNDFLLEKHGLSAARIVDQVASLLPAGSAR